MSDAPDGFTHTNALDDDLTALAAEEELEVSTFEGFANRDGNDVTGELHILLDLDDGPTIDDVLAGNTDKPDDVDADELEAAVADHPAGRFPDENVAERVDPPAASRLAPPEEVTHRPPTADETDDERRQRIEKQSMSRQERRRRGW